MNVNVSTRPINVLVVDDQLDGRVALQHMLSGSGYRVVEASSGDEALERLLREEFAVVLVDVRMPEMDGFELATIVRRRERTRALPIIFLTGEDATSRDIEKGYAIGAVDYLVKPVRPEVVRAKVAVFAELYAQRDQIQKQAEGLRVAQLGDQERRLADLRLANERRFRAVTDAMPQIVWTARADGYVDYFNRRWFEYTELAASDAVPAFRPAVHAEDVDACVDAWCAAVAAGQPFEYECRLRRAHDGIYRWHLARAVPEYDQTGAIIAWLGTFTDIDDQKLAQREAQDAVRLRDEFLSVASHELKTPLASLALQVQSLARAVRPAPGVARLERAALQLGVIERQIGRLTRLIDELLDVSRIAAGKLRLEIEEVDLSALTRDVVQRLDEDARRAGCRIEVRAEPPVVGRWDRLRMEQVLTNLLTNAMKFGRGKPIEVSVEQIDENARLTVRDYGVGIGPENRARIFGRFERAISAREFGGLGLGLYITREIVENHKGTITVESRIDEGARFIVTLPLTPSEEEPAPAASP